MPKGSVRQVVSQRTRCTRRARSARDPSRTTHWVVRAADRAPSRASPDGLTPHRLGALAKPIHAPRGTARLRHKLASLACRHEPRETHGSGPAALFVALGLAACGGEAASSSRALLELERLSFEPSRLVLAPGVPFAAWSPPLLVDRFEVTREQWLAWAAVAGIEHEEALARHVEGWAAETRDWPATYLTLGEARAFAAQRGMRLPTFEEWMRFARGPSGWDYPWGQAWQNSIANTLELDLRRPAPVGTFEAGASPAGIYDLVGNVAEWVEAPPPGPAQLELPLAEHTRALGGSFRTHARPLARPQEDPLGTELHQDARADDVGFRCVVEAESFLWSRSSRWGGDRASALRLRAIGRRWGRAALPLLQALAERPGAPRSLSALLDGARS